MSDNLGHTLLILALYVLVAARLTRLVNYDTILDPARLWIARRASTATIAAAHQELPEAKEPFLRRQRRWTATADFLACPWCVGIWVSAACSPAVVAVLDWPWWTVTVLTPAASHLIGVADPLASEDMEIVDEG